MKCGVVVFPGSNCDHDVYHVLKHVLNQDVSFLWHDEETLQGAELVVLPGGFAYGDSPFAGASAMVFADGDQALADHVEDVGHTIRRDVGAAHAVRGIDAHR